MRSAKAFSLIELIVAMALSLIVIATFSTLLNTTSKYSSKLVFNKVKTQNVLAIYNFLKQDLSEIDKEYDVYYQEIPTSIFVNCCNNEHSFKFVETVLTFIIFNENNNLSSISYRVFPEFTKLDNGNIYFTWLQRSEAPYINNPVLGLNYIKFPGIIFKENEFKNIIKLLRENASSKSLNDILNFGIKLVNVKDENNKQSKSIQNLVDNSGDIVINIPNEKIYKNMEKKIERYQFTIAIANIKYDEK